MRPFASCKISCAKTKLECVNDVTSIVLKLTSYLDWESDSQLNLVMCCKRLIRVVLNWLFEAVNFSALRILQLGQIIRLNHGCSYIGFRYFL